MSLLGMTEARLPPGFRFHPRDDELVCDYLMRKVCGDGGLYGHPMMIDVDLNKCEPWDLPETACVGGKQWYFFTLRDRKYATGQRTNRATQSGYWKATGKDRQVRRRGELVGMRKTLVFYQGRAPKGRKSEWVMHEFRMAVLGDPRRFSPPREEDWVLCRVSHKSRGATSKPAMETGDDETISASLPPLMDSYATFKQAPLSSMGYEQVSCFSNLNPHPASLSNDAANPIPMVQRSLETTISGHMGGLLYLGSSDTVINSVLNHFTKLEEGNPKVEIPPPNVAPRSCLSFFSGNGLSYMWNPF